MAGKRKAQKRGWVGGANGRAAKAEGEVRCGRSVARGEDASGTGLKAK